MCAPPYCYRCPFGLNYPSCGLACVKAMETTILGEGPETVAEVIVEPVMSGVGVAVPPDEYLPEVESLCRKYGILLHVDEVINGFGRTGKMFAHQHYGVSPDIVAVAKGISSAYQPIAATVVKNKRVRQLLRRPGGKPAGGAGQHLWRPSGRGGGRAAQHRDHGGERLVARAAEIGAYLLDGLSGLTSHKAVGDVRGKGLLIGVELVKDRATKEQLDPAQFAAVVDFCRDHRRDRRPRRRRPRFGTTVALCPPLVITRAECDRIVDTLGRALAALDAS